MMHRTLLALLLVASGVVIGFTAKWRIAPVTCSSPSECFDEIAVRQCQAMPKDNTAAVRHRADNADAPPLGVNDWLFVTYCKGGPAEIELTFDAPDTV